MVDHVGVGHRLHLLDVGAGGEDLLAAPDDDRRDVLALGRLAARGDQAVLDLGVEGVHRGPVEADGADAVLDLEAHEVGHGVPARRRRRRRRSGRCRAPAGARCARRTGSPGSTPARASTGRRRASTRCSPVTTRVEPATPLLTQFMLRLSSLHVSCSLSRSPSRSSWICHWPKTRMISTSPSEHRTKSCWSLTVNATSPSVSRLGWSPRSTSTSRTRPRSGCSSARRREVGQRRGIGHGSNRNHSLGSPPCRRRPDPAPAPGAARRATCRRPPGSPSSRAAPTSRSTPGTPTGSRSACSTPATRRATTRAARPARRAGPRLVVRLRPRHAAGPALQPARPRRLGPRQRPAAQPRQAAARPLRPGRRGRGRAGVRRSTATSSTRRWHGDGELRSDLDSRGHVPRCVVVDDAFDWEDDRPPGRSRSETVIYEAHVRNQTTLHPDVPRSCAARMPGWPTRRRSPTSLGSASPPSSCCPCTRSPTSRTSRAAGMTNHWGYNTLGLLRPAPPPTPRPTTRRVSSTRSRAWSSCCTARASR